MYRPVVYIVDDDPSLRRSLALWLGFCSLATRDFASAEQFLEELAPPCWGCAIVDMRMGGMDGLQLQAQLRTRKIELPVLFLTGHGDVPTVRNALKSGAFDFLEKPIDNQQLIERVGAALALDEARWQGQRQAELVRERIARLTARERAVMEQVVAGRHNREIAAQLGISARTVEVYKARLMDKLDVHRVADLVRFSMGGQAQSAPPVPADDSARHG